ncbi:hypothetical protein HMPREF3208_00860 [Gardnerella vaginalis]|uniref:Uncharacterized protein n=1 Tax=Gardnerella vaginalis TaxID=2702 RepID=A0A133NV67_GARVA|nr:hypothetical protein HMPREF3208_00860 [Gardnerella vaginalis]
MLIMCAYHNHSASLSPKAYSVKIWQVNLLSTTYALNADGTAQNGTAAALNAANGAR